MNRIRLFTEVSLVYHHFGKYIFSEKVLDIQPDIFTQNNYTDIVV